MSEIHRNYAIKIEGKEDVKAVETVILAIQKEMGCSRTEALSHLLAFGAQEAMEETKGD